MVKFDKQFFHHQVPEWKEFYLDYDNLIAILNQLSKYRVLTNQTNFRETPVRKISSNDVNEDKHIEKDLLVTLTGSINDMEINQEDARINDYNVIKAHLIEEKKLFDKFCDLYLKSINTMNDFFLKSLNEFGITYNKLKLNFKDHEPKLVDPDEKAKEKLDESGYSTSWKRAYLELYNKSSWLHGFGTINKIASLKLLQKCKQLFHDSCVFQDESHYLTQLGKEISKLEKMTEEFKFITEIDSVNDLRFKICQTYADSFCKGDLEISKQDLENVLKGGITRHSNYVMFYLGIFFSLIFMCCVLTNISSKLLNKIYI